MDAPFDEEKLSLCLKKSGSDKKIESLPNGIETSISKTLDNDGIEFSGGEGQKLALARAIYKNAPILVLDEPTSALDPISTTRIEELAMELKSKYTIIIVTHNMQQALRISNKTAFFLLGELVECDDTEKIFSKPQDKRTEDYITGRFG